MASEYPKHDTEFEDVRIKKVEASSDGKGWFIDREDGWGFFVGPECPITPEAGMVARLYGKGIGYPFRGQFIDGRKVFYRTESEDREHRDIELYGADAADWLSRWDADRSVWSISMGGLGPGYEQAIQITAAEILRHLLAAKYDASLWQDKDVWTADRNAIDKAVSPVITGLGLSGAQWGAAMSLATKLYMDGPLGVMAEPSIKDRHIQVSKAMPRLSAA